MFLHVFNKIAKAGNIALACRVLILLGCRNRQKLKKSQTCYFLKQEDGNVWGGFCEITENGSREVAKNDRFLHSFFAPGGITQRLRFTIPLMVFGNFAIFQDPEIQKGQKPLEG